MRARSMVFLLAGDGTAGRRTGVVLFQACHQLPKEGALFEVTTQTGMCRREPVQREHLLHRIGVAEEHHDFLQVWAAHGITPAPALPATPRFLPVRKARPAPGADATEGPCSWLTARHLVPVWRDARRASERVTVVNFNSERRDAGRAMKIKAL
jgi:hypothetical protein